MGVFEELESAGPDPFESIEKPTPREDPFAALDGAKPVEQAGPPSPVEPVEDPFFNLPSFGEVADETVRLLQNPKEIGPAALKGLETELGIKRLETPEGAGRGKLKTFWGKVKDRMVKQGEALTEPFTARKEAFDADGLTGLWKENLRRSGIPGAEDAIGILDHPDGLEGHAKDRVAGLFGARDNAQFKERSASENFSGLMATQIADTIERTQLPGAKNAGRAGGELAGKAGAGAIKLGTAQVPLAADFMRKNFTNWDEANKVTQTSIKVYESVSGRRWIPEGELAQLRTKDPTAFRKAHRAQSPLGGSLLSGVAEIGQAIGSLAVDPTVLADPNTLAFMVGSQLDDMAQSFENPEKRMFEDPLQFLMDVSPAPVVKGVAKLDLARQIMHEGPGIKGFGDAAQAAIGLPGPAGLLQAVPGARKLIPKNLQRGEAAGNAAASRMYDQVLSEVVRNSDWVREMISTAPDAPRSVVAATVKARQGIAGMQEKINRVSRDLAKDAGIRVRPLKGIPENKPPTTPEGKAFASYVEELEGNADALHSFAVLHDKVAQRASEIKADHFAGRKVSHAERRIVYALDDPRMLMAMAKDPKILDILNPKFNKATSEAALLQSVIQIAKTKDPDALLAASKASVAGHAKAARLLLKRTEVASDPVKVADIKARMAGHRAKGESLKEAVKDPRLENADVPKLQAELEELRAFSKGVGEFQERMMGAESLKQHGAWLEINGKPLGGVEGTLEVLSLRRKGLSTDDIFDTIKVGGSNPRMQGVMSRAKEIARIASWQDSRLVHHGLMSETVAAADFAARFNRIRDPLRAADFDPGAIALNPHARLEQGMVVQHLDYLEDIGKQLPDIAGPTRARSNKFGVGGVDMEGGWVGKQQVVRLPQSTSTVDGIKIPTYGSMAGRWVSRDAAELIQTIVGTKQTAIQKLVQPLVKNKVINNLFGSHVNALVGEALTSALAGVDVATAWPRAMLMMRGKGSKSQRMLAKHALEEAGVFDAASARSIDELAGNAQSFTSLMKQFGDHLKDGELGVFDRLGGAGATGLRIWNDKVVGWNGAKEHLWNARDKMVRLALYEDALHKYALHNKNLTAKDLKNPANMRALLDDPTASNFALQASVDKALDYLSLPRGPRGPDGLGGRGTYQLAKDIGVMPFIAYPIKAGGLWTKEFFTSPAKYEFLTQGHRMTWDQVEEHERQQRLAGDRPGDRGWTAAVGRGTNSTINTRFAQPIANLALDMFSVSSKELLPFYATPFAEALFKRTVHGREIPNPLAYVVMKTFLDPGTQKLIGVGQAGAVEKLTGAKSGQIDPLTKLPPIPLAEWAKLFINVSPRMAERNSIRMANAWDRYYFEELSIRKKADSRKKNFGMDQISKLRAANMRELFEATGSISMGPPVGGAASPLESR